MSRKTSKAPPFVDVKSKLELLKLSEEISAVAWRRRRDMVICFVLVAGVFIQLHTAGVLTNVMVGKLARLW